MCVPRRVGVSSRGAWGKGGPLCRHLTARRIEFCFVNSTLVHYACKKVSFSEHSRASGAEADNTGVSAEQASRKDSLPPPALRTLTSCVLRAHSTSNLPLALRRRFCV